MQFLHHAALSVRANDEYGVTQEDRFRVIHVNRAPIADENRAGADIAQGLINAIFVHAGFRFIGDELIAANPAKGKSHEHRLRLWKGSDCA